MVIPFQFSIFIDVRALCTRSLRAAHAHTKFREYLGSIFYWSGLQRLIDACEIEIALIAETCETKRDGTNKKKKRTNQTAKWQTQIAIKNQPADLLY